MEIVRAYHNLLFPGNEPGGPDGGLADFYSFDRGLLLVVIDRDISRVESHQEPRQLLMKLSGFDPFRTRY